MLEAGARAARRCPSAATRSSAAAQVRLLRRASTRTAPRTLLRGALAADRRARRERRRRVAHRAPAVGDRVCLDAGLELRRRRRLRVHRRRRRPVLARTCRAGRTCTSLTLRRPEEELTSMAKQPRSLSGKVAAVTGGGRGIGRAITRGADRARARASRSATSTARPRSAPPPSSATRSSACRSTSPTSPASRAFLDEVERRLGPLDVARQQRRDHADHAARARSPRRASRASSRSTCARSSTARRRRCAGCARAAPATSSTSPRWPARRGYPNLATYCGDQARRRRALGGRARSSCSGSGVEVSVRHAGHRQHRALERHGRGARRQEPHARAGRGRGRRRAQGPALRRLRPALDRPAAQGRRDRCRAAPARRSRR